MKLSLPTCPNHTHMEATKLEKLKKHIKAHMNIVFPRKAAGRTRAADDAHRDRSEAGLQGARQTGGRVGGRKACTVHHALCTMPCGRLSRKNARGAFSRSVDRPADGYGNTAGCAHPPEALNAQVALRGLARAHLHLQKQVVREGYPPQTYLYGARSLGARLLRTSLMLPHAPPFLCAGSGKTWTGIPIIAANMDTTGTFGELLLLFP